MVAVRCKMRSVSDILDRAFSLLIIADRGLLESESHSGDTYSLQEREDKRVEFQTIIESRSLDSYLLPNEMMYIRKHVGELSVDVFWKTQHQHEAIPVLLWAIGLHPFPSYVPEFSSTDFHNILGPYRTERWQQIPVLRPELDVRIYYGVVFLWHWRSREGRNAASFKNEASFKIIRKIFGDEFEPAFQHIRVASTQPSDFIAGKQRYSELDERSANTLNIVAKWRHHALEWVLGSDTWEETKTNT